MKKYKAKRNQTINDKTVINLNKACRDLNDILEIWCPGAQIRIIDPTFYKNELIFAIYTRILNQNLVHFSFRKHFCHLQLKSKLHSEDQLLINTHLPQANDLGPHSTK